PCLFVLDGCSRPSHRPSPSVLLGRCDFFFESSGAPRHLHSFPTRRSSDLVPFAHAQQLSPPGVFCGLLYQEGRGSAYALAESVLDRKSTRLNSSHVKISYAVFCLKKKKKQPCTETTDAQARPAVSSGLHDD